LRRTAKWCYACQRELPIQAFAFNRAKLDGHADECRQCRRDYDKLRVQRNVQRNLALRAHRF
jgi:hypothetical protein